MARIRTIKPAFFRHTELYEAEIATKMPLRVAFAGLWTVADREGRFKWRPQEIKLDILPYDNVDISRVLDALATRGFIIKYEYEGKFFGVIPSFNDHQVINNREAESELPDIEKSNIIHMDSSNYSRVPHACPTRHNPAQGEGKGREGNMEGNMEVNTRVVFLFDDFWDLYPRKLAKRNAEKAYAAAIKCGAKHSDIMAGLNNCLAEWSSWPNDRKQFIPHASTWLNGHRWNDDIEKTKAYERPTDVYLRKLAEKFPEDENNE